MNAVDPTLLARNVELRVIFDGRDVAVNIRRYITGLTYTDFEEEYADDLQITLQDREDEWLEWLHTPTDKVKGATLSALIEQKNWDSKGKSKLLDCGTFEVDTISYSTPPSKLTLKASAVPHSSRISQEKKSRAWEHISLSGIAREIAAKGGLSYFFDSQYDPYYMRREQNQESDLAFLGRICADAGVSLKVTSRMLVLFDEAAYEKKDVVRYIKKGEGNVISCRMDTGTNDTAYSSCEVSYMDPVTEQTISYTYTPQGAAADGPVLTISEKVSSTEEARRLAEKRFRQRNKGENKAEFTLVGDAALVSGVTVQVGGYGFFDGKYIVEEAVHRISSGYQTDIKMHKVLEGY